MHFSIPHTQELIDDAGNSYLAYNIHINGLFHCTVRYKQLLNLHEQLSRDMDVTLPAFPPKKFFPLTSNQQEDRRLGLEKYIQTIGQNSAINNSELLNGFLLNAQQETFEKGEEVGDFDVFLLNDQKITLQVVVGEPSSIVLQKVCQYIHLADKYLHYFCLFVVHEDTHGNIIILRKLQDFESPYLTHSNLQYDGIKVVLARGYWDVSNNVELSLDKVALKLLYSQAVSEVARGWILVPEKFQGRLREAQQRDNHREYLELVSNMKYYGYIHFATCYCDYPEPGTKVLVAIGRNELILRVFLDDTENEVVFKVTRMRCWRITTLHSDLINRKDDDYSLELSFEYLVARNKLQWITISSQQAILMSVCMQSMIDELLLKHVVVARKNTDSPSKSWTYVMRDGHSRLVMAPREPGKIVETKQNESSRSEAIFKKLSERFAVGKVRKSDDTHRTDRPGTSNCDMENNAFHMIGDEDL